MQDLLHLKSMLQGPVISSFIPALFHSRIHTVFTCIPTSSPFILSCLLGFVLFFLLFVSVVLFFSSDPFARIICWFFPLHFYLASASVSFSLGTSNLWIITMAGSLRDQ